MASDVFTVEDLGLTFSLPEGFSETDEGYAFSAARSDPRAFLSIEEYESVPPLEGYEPREGETVAALVLDGANALQITDSAMDGLPPGVSANTLIVDNGEDSFSLILSGAEVALSEAWETLVSTMEIEPAF